MLYATDTGVFPEEAWPLLSGWQFHVSVMEQTMGHAETAGHMNLEQWVEHRERLEKEGMAAPGCRFLATHIGHHWNPGHQQLEGALRRHGGEPAYDAVGMQLFRKCPCPVLLVGVHATRRRRVLAAVAPNPDDPVEQTLNRKILELTVFLAEKEGHEPHVLHVWEPFGEELLKSHTTEAEVEAYIEAARQTARAELDEVLAPFTGRIAGAHVHLERGEPGAFIPDFVGRHGIDLVVMGSVARTGIAGFVMGNTAEHVLSSLTCSVLAVKPDGFECPVRLE